MVEDRADRRYQPVVKTAGYADRVPAELAKSCQPAGHWIALPLQVYRINTLFCPPRAWSAPASPRRRPPGPSSTMSPRR